MIKSYKYVLIIQIILLFLLWFLFKDFYIGNPVFKVQTPALFIIGLSPTLLLLLSVLFQKILVFVINSDSLKSNSENVNVEEKTWQIAFFTNMIFCGVTFLASLVLIFVKSDIEIYNYGDVVARAMLLLVAIVFSSLLIGLFIRIKNTVWEVNKTVGIIMIVLSILVFSGAVYFPSLNMLQSKSSDYDETLVGIDSTATASDEDYIEDEEGEMYPDYFLINNLDHSDVETGGYFQQFYDRGTDDNEKSSALLKLFLVGNLEIKKGKDLSELRNSITYGYTAEEFSEINEIQDQMGREPEEIHKAFESYKFLLYAFVTDQIYFESNLNIIVDALIQSHEDIYATENPEATLKKINTIMNMGYKERFPYEYYDSLEMYFSEDVLEPIKNSAKSYGTEAEYNWKLNAIWVYSFWSRRNEEKNVDAVFNILKEIQAEYETM